MCLKRCPDPPHLTVLQMPRNQSSKTTPQPISNLWLSLAAFTNASMMFIGRDLWVLAISDNPTQHEAGEPEFQYIGNMHGNEVVGRELLLLFARFLCENHRLPATPGAKPEEREANVIHWLISNTRWNHWRHPYFSYFLHMCMIPPSLVFLLFITVQCKHPRIHIMPTMNPDGYARAREGDYESVLGRPNAHSKDLNRNFPDRYLNRHSFECPTGHGRFEILNGEKLEFAVERE